MLRYIQEVDLYCSELESSELNPAHQSMQTIKIHSNLIIQSTKGNLLHRGVHNPMTKTVFSLHCNVVLAR